MQESASNEIDIVGVLRFFWRSAFPIIGGALGGTLLGFGFAKLQPGGFDSQVDVSIDPGSLPAVSDPADLEKVFSEVAGSPTLTRRAFDSLLAGEKQLKEQLAGSGSDLNDWIIAQSSDNAKSRIFSLVQGNAAGDFTLNIRLPFRGLDGKNWSGVESMVNAVCDGFNKYVTSSALAAATAAVADAKRAISEFEGTGFKSVLEAQRERTRLRTELAGVEYGLMGKASESTLKLFQFSIPSQILAPRTDVSPVDNSQTELQVARIMRLMGSLSESGRLRPEESRSFFGRVTMLQAELQRNEEAINSVYRPYLALLTGLSDALKRQTLPVEREKKFLPLFRVNSELMTEKTKRGLLEKPRRSGLMGAFGGLILGGFLAFLGCIGKQFLQMNWRAIIARDS